MAQRKSPSLARFTREDDGSISIEFILVLPILILWLLGSFVFFDAYRSFSQTEKLAYTITDIVSRHDEVGVAEIDELRAIQSKMAPPRSTDNWMRISSICFNDGIFTVLWSTTRSDSSVTITPLVTDDIPVAIMPVMAEQDTVILTEVSGRWTPLAMSVGANVVDFDNDLVVRPRFTRAIPHTTLNTDTLCPEDTSDSGGGGGSIDDGEGEGGVDQGGQDINGDGDDPDVIGAGGN